ncbi:MAG: hypothetical protein CO029_01170 [Candidatus Magasanikbacteria bacterium CG_4_9_14_0_2_um_filter_41_10]|uniref:Uncharacterized protein n=1 Tax=Candidatus Magasanikbacteria bacterium CG_4_10_14_0_2_um_filter_41_31 TaxID=1974639 RepID=A0A2M7V2M4_9BACT|nr:MAG: hypothetical protein AUJ37_03105 [Candidatus Magasanikbacteria bacterium CG1_02_41_34]PIZ92602.1 MAG: hypothetical protein COX83_03885 [Candidatus Magasanikbacteria bacterium CG_4_10_14_0_2_um_filter_41_31]PJC53748.1 MAG: hypothetical protein CO029_01170 [Candidatus Magasanikbacteria bacterium CG_4_9_14_0_2_um_filter_41_10]
MPVMKNFHHTMHASQQRKHGFSLLEIVVAVGIFAIFVIGIYSGIQFVFKLVYNSRVRIIETSLLNEQIEGIRNMSFYDVGIVNGSPSGLLERTVTTTRNNIDFEITRTIRNIDDPFDGVIDPGGGSSGGECQQSQTELCHDGSTLCVGQNAVQGHLNHGDTEGACGADDPVFDNQPSDYKFVDVEILCTSCNQQVPVSMSTYLAPKFLEGDPTHGALFIHVINASGQIVQGATVHVVSTITNPTYNFYDTTDNDGKLAVVDLAAGIAAYDITVTKNGYTTDQTVSSTVSNPNPTKPFGTVIAQDLTELYFTIDAISEMSVQTLNAYCTPIGSTGISLVGTKKIGTSPDVLLTDLSVTTNGSGQYTFSDLVWDTYQFDVSGYDIIGSIPNERIDLLPGVTQPVSLILGSVSTNALRVDVVDSVTGQPIADATVLVTSTSFSQEKITGVGTVGQTDWFGGSGQETIGDDARFFDDDSNVDVLTSAGNITLRDMLGQYAASGWLESSTFDLGLNATYQNIIWEPLSQPSETGLNSVRFQIATANSTSPSSWSYLGPDGTTGSYYTTIDTVISDAHDGDRYIRYMAYMSTASTTYTPTLSNVSFTYTNSCTPPGQTYFGGLSATDYTVTVSATGYESESSNVTVGGYTKLTVSLQGS